MTSCNLPTSACRYCQHYQPEGRRGGQCQILDVPVQGNWKACSLAVSAFAPNWDLVEEMMSLTSASVLAATPVTATLKLPEPELLETEFSHVRIHRQQQALLV
jgi:hypothetical protein